MQRQFDGPSLTTQRAGIEQAVEEFYAWCDALLADRRGSLGDDLVSALVREEQDGDRLSDVELVNLVLNVLIGGVDTTTAQLAHGLRLFAEHPEQWQALRDDPSLVPRAVEEVLRHEPITPFTARVLTADVVFRDVLFPAGTVVMIGAWSGDRDGAGDPAFDVRADRGGARLHDLRRRHPPLPGSEPGPGRAGGGVRRSSRRARPGCGWRGSRSTAPCRGSTGWSGSTSRGTSRPGTSLCPGTSRPDGRGAAREVVEESPGSTGQGGR